VLLPLAFGLVPAQTLLPQMLVVLLAADNCHMKPKALLPRLGSGVVKELIVMIDFDGYSC
jgi:hypothetical protein